MFWKFWLVTLFSSGSIRLNLSFISRRITLNIFHNVLSRAIKRNWLTYFLSYYSFLAINWEARSSVIQLLNVSKIQIFVIIWFHNHLNLERSVSWHFKETCHACCYKRRGVFFLWSVFETSCFWYTGQQLDVKIWENAWTDYINIYCCVT